MSGDRVIENLREAVRLSPENIPLRRHLAESLLGLGKADLAEAEFRETLTLAPDDVALKVGLASAFAQQGKNTLAVVILEDVTRRPMRLRRRLWPTRGCFLTRGIFRRQSGSIAAASRLIPLLPTRNSPSGWASASSGRDRACL